MNPETKKIAFPRIKCQPRALAVAAVTLLSAASAGLEQASAAGPLRWAPPQLTNPITIELGKELTYTKRLDNDKDYIIKLPTEKKVGSVTLEGGRNIVLQGGHITVPPNDERRRAIYILNAVGTVHIEGVLIDNSGDGSSPSPSDFDGIAIKAPSAIVQIQNVRIVGLTGSRAGEHADIVQPWGGVKELRIDHLTGTSNYQGLQIPPDVGPIGSAILQNINLGYIPGPEQGYLLWLTQGDQSCTTYPITLSNVYVAAKSGQPVGQSVWPPSDKTWMQCAAVQTGNQVSWPNLLVTGFVFGGAPPNGDFVPQGVAGVGYVSPGYGQTNLVANPSFDAENYNTQTPSGWSEWGPGTDANASYTESNGGAHSGLRHATHWGSAAYEVRTDQFKTGLANGLYTLRAWVKGSAHTNGIARMQVRDFGNGTYPSVAIPNTNIWTQIEIKDINVTNGNCTIRFYSKAQSGQWIYFDDVEFFKQ